MLKYLLFSLISVAVANGASLDGRIIGGETVSIESYPFQLSLLYKGLHACGASVISKRFAVTAAQCTNGLSTSDFSIRAGSSFRNSGGTIIRIKRIHEHPLYSHLYVDFDMSLLELDSELEFSATIQPIALPVFYQKIPAGALGVASGWGTTTDGGSASQQLRAVNINVVSSEDCERAYEGVVFTERMLCAGSVEGKGICTGDAGGPLVVEGELVGIASWSYGCARPEYPGVYASVPIIRRFITEVTGI